MKRLSAIVILALVVSTTFASDCTTPGRGFAPENRMRIPVNSPDRNAAIDEAIFNDLISKVESVYVPVAQSMGAKLTYVRKWTDATVNAYAEQPTTLNWKVTMFGGLARHKKMTADGMLLVVCHETGHHMGGAPRKANSWASNEGQSDYFGTLKCFRRVLEREDNVAVVQSMGKSMGRAVPIQITKECEASFKTLAEIALCQRAGVAGLDLATVLNSLGSSTTVPDPSKPAAGIVSATNDAHPKAQCRFDTYIAGAVCQVPWTEKVSTLNPVQGTCASEAGYTEGTRPLCWYKPTK